MYTRSFTWFIKPHRLTGCENTLRALDVIMFLPVVICLLEVSSSRLMNLLQFDLKILHIIFNSSRVFSLWFTDNCCLW